MEFLGVGPSELIFIIIIALIVLGPKDMQKAGRTLGKWMRSIVTSDGWKMFQQTSRELRTLPNRLMREANEDLNQIGKDINKELNNVSSTVPQQENSISSWMKTPDITPRSQPIPASSKPTQSAETKNEPPAPASSEQENDQGENA
jgi:sec-independent protein translocase protein TatB